jgi:hypothetical protein
MFEPINKHLIQPTASVGTETTPRRKTQRRICRFEVAAAVLFLLRWSTYGNCTETKHHNNNITDIHFPLITSVCRHLIFLKTFSLTPIPFCAMPVIVITPTIPGKWHWHEGVLGVSAVHCQHCVVVVGEWSSEVKSTHLHEATTWCYAAPHAPKAAQCSAGHADQLCSHTLHHHQSG